VLFESVLVGSPSFDLFRVRYAEAVISKGLDNIDSLKNIVSATSIRRFLSVKNRWGHSKNIGFIQE
jgi:hypothetical protein